MTLVLGEMDIARVNLYHSCQDEPSGRLLAWFALYRSVAATNFRGGSMSVSFSVNDIRQARITRGVGGCGIGVEFPQCFLNFDAYCSSSANNGKDVRDIISIHGSRQICDGTDQLMLLTSGTHFCTS